MGSVPELKWFRTVNDLEWQDPQSPDRSSLIKRGESGSGAAERWQRSHLLSGHECTSKKSAPIPIAEKTGDNNRKSIKPLRTSFFISPALIRIEYALYYPIKAPERKIKSVNEVISQDNKSIIS